MEQADIFVLPTPGHTLGSVSLVIDVDGKKTRLRDLMHSPGNSRISGTHKSITVAPRESIWDPFRSLDCGTKARFALPIPRRASERSRPWNSGNHRSPRGVLPFPDWNSSVLSRGYAVSPHFIAHHLTTSSFYAILSNSGKAMFIDYGSASSTHLEFRKSHSRYRSDSFVEHNIDDLKSALG
jgi:hypothetical protein